LTFTFSTSALKIKYSQFSNMPHTTFFRFLLLSWIILGASGCDTKDGLEPGSGEHIRIVSQAVDDARLVNADETPGDWLSYGRNYQENRYSPLNQITKSNINELGLAWSINLGTTRGIEATPIVVDGIMYLTGPWSIVYAIDARKGEILWIYDPEVPKGYGEKACCDVVNRGVALYKGMVYVGSLDGRLIAIDAASGKKAWEIITVDQTQAYTITGAPRVVDGKVIIGNGGAEYGVRGYVTAYDALTSEQLWRFYTVPGNPTDEFEDQAMAEAAKTWTGEWWTMGGGGTAWDAMAYDPRLNLLYIGVGNGSPWNREIRSPGGGDNLYLSSIVALNPDNGELVWHYQTTPGDSWDFTATQHIILANLEIEGFLRKVLMQAPKNGFFYVLDRTNGEFISAEPYVYVNWAKRIDYQTGRPVETSFSRYVDANVAIMPMAGGGHNWQPMAFNPKTGLVYIPAIERSMIYGQPKNWKFNKDPRHWNVGIGFDEEKPVIKNPQTDKRYGKLIAWDPTGQKAEWVVNHPNDWNAGVLTTEELVFQGNAAGNFVVYDAETGKELWSFSLQTGIIAAPSTYSIDGIQYVTIAAGWGGAGGTKDLYTDQLNPGAIYTFVTGGNENPPEFPKHPPKKLIDLAFEATEEALNHGGELYRKCSVCHGGGNLPDLHYSSAEIFDLFPRIVGEGLFLGKGMPNYGDRYSDQDILDIKHFILSEAQKRRTANYD
jgi:quinohemoprotein ethanol dehydrogenase